MEETETLIDLFHSRTKISSMWSQLMQSFHSGLLIPPIALQSAFFEFNDHKSPTNKPFTTNFEIKF